MDRLYEKEREMARMVEEAPDSTGVYILKDRQGRHLYVGKSLSIRKRLADHWRAAREGVEKERMIVYGAASAEWVLTETELEALILEDTLIKRHQPVYNVVMRDDKHYPYLRMNLKEDFPRVTVVRRVERDGARYFGPYVSASAMRKTLHWLGCLFPLRKCDDDRMASRRRPCLDFEIGRCLAPCSEEVDRAEYREAVDELVLFLRGRHLDLKRRLERRMARASREMRYEEAARIRDRLREMAPFFERQAVYGKALPSADVVGLAGGAGGWLAYVLLVRRGSVVGGEPHNLQAAPGTGEDEVLGAFIERFYAGRADIPPRVMVPVEVPGRKLLERFLSSVAGRRVTIGVPMRGRGLELMLLARKNALNFLGRKGKKWPPPPAADWEAAGIVLAGGVPGRIEVYDASSLHGREAVVGMVLWEDGGFEKSGYRRFRMKRDPGMDDYAMIREAVSRRLARVGRGEEAPPDLILVDGGAGHVSAVRAELERAGFDFPVAGLSKGERRREGDRLHLADGSAPDLAQDSPLVRFLASLRDEVHRWAVSYHRRRRGMELRRSSLDEVKGLGPRRRAILLRHFGDPRAVARATLEELLAVPGIPAGVARAVHRRFRSAGD